MTSAGPFDAITDVPGIEVGHATDLQGGTGCTIVLARDGATPAVFQPGGAPGTLDTDLARSENAVPSAHAILLTGGSVFGLEASAGVRNRLGELGIGAPFGPAGTTIPIVLGAVVFDLGLGEASHPSVEDGRAAVDVATSGPVSQGTVGVGTGCTVAKTGGIGTQIKGGVGTASLLHESGLIVGAMVATNAVGDIVDPSDGSLVAGARNQESGAMQRASESLLSRSLADYEEAMRAMQPPASDQAGANTTLAVIATNAKLHKGTAKRVAIMGSTGLARTISPIFTPGDGDTIFTLATGQVDVTTIPTLLTLTGTMAAEVVALASLRSVRLATSLAGVPSVSEWTARQSEREISDD